MRKRETNRGPQMLRSLWAERPLAVDTRWLRSLLAVPAEEPGAFLPTLFEAAPAAAAEPEGPVAVVPVHGPLVYRNDLLTGLLGFTAYEDVREMVEAALAAPGVEAVALDLDTPGGEVRGLFETAAAIRQMADRAGKPLLAVANTDALSAGYALAAVADRVLALPSSELGSIGVVAGRLDVTGADEKAGEVWTFVAAGARKLDFNPHVPMSDDAREAMQRDVDELYAAFVEHVARHRGLSAETVRATEADILRGPEAVRLGLADGIVGGLEQAVGSITSRRIVMQDEKVIAQAEVPETPEPAAEAELPEPEAAVEAPEPQAASAAPAAPDPAEIERRVKERAAEVAQVAQLAARLGVHVDLAEAIASGASADALRQRVLEALAAQTDGRDVVAAAPPPKPEPVAASSDPIVEAARRLAEKYRNRKE